MELDWIEFRDSRRYLKTPEDISRSSKTSGDLRTNSDPGSRSRRSHPFAMCLEQTGSASAAAVMAEIRSGSESMQRMNERLSL